MANNARYQKQVDDIVTFRRSPRLLILCAVSFLAIRLFSGSRTELRYMNFLIATEDNVIANLTFAIPTSMAITITTESSSEMYSYDGLDRIDNNEDDTETIEEQPMLMEFLRQDAALENDEETDGETSENKTDNTISEPMQIKNPENETLRTNSSQRLQLGYAFINSTKTVTLKRKVKVKVLDKNNKIVDLSRESVSLFRKPSDLRIGDVYSGMWWTSVDVLLAVPTDKMTWLEAATFMVVLGQVSKRVLMTTDVLDFSVEHLSTFFRFLRFDLDIILKQNEYTKCIEALQNYTARVMHSSPYHHNQAYSPAAAADSNTENSVQVSIQQTPTIPIEFRQTIAIIPFGLVSLFKENVDPGFKIRSESLIATLTSIWQLGIGRAVIVGGVTQEEADAVHNIIFPQFSELLLNSSVETGNQNRPSMELGFVGGNAMTKNLPREAIQGLQYVFSGNITVDQPGDTIDMVTHRWLGTLNISKWKYVYFTEPDLILHTRPRTIPYLANGLRKGKILMAHRLQLVQHGSDFPNFTDRSLLIPAIGNFTNVATIDSYAGDGCLLLGSNDKAGLTGPRCRKLWWRCGFGHKDRNYSDVNEVHKLFRLYKSYDLIRLEHGTRFVTLAGTQQRNFCNIIKHNATSIPKLPIIDLR